VGEPKISGKILSVICRNMQFLTKDQHIITKFSFQRLSYIHKKYSLGRQWGQTSDWGAWLPWPPLEPPLQQLH